MSEEDTDAAAADDPSTIFDDSLGKHRRRCGGSRSLGRARPCR